jgi:two-component system response regulator AdeR
MSATILCVQEDREICQIYMDALEAEGFESLPAHDGGHALEILRRQRPDFVVLDVRLPRQDGFEILAEMRTSSDADVPPVLMLCEGDVTPDVIPRRRSLRIASLRR